MQNISDMSIPAFKQVIKDSVKETLSEKRIKKIFVNVLEDISMGKAIEEGLKTETINKDSFRNKLKKRIANG